MCARHARTHIAKHNSLYKCYVRVVVVDTLFDSVLSLSFVHREHTSPSHVCVWLDRCGTAGIHTLKKQQQKKRTNERTKKNNETSFKFCCCLCERKKSRRKLAALPTDSVGDVCVSSFQFIKDNSCDRANTPRKRREYFLKFFFWYFF